jgi:molybdopterin converting factor subunit 1
MKIKIKYFASIRDLIGLNGEHISIQQGSTVENLLDSVKKIHQQLRTVENILIAVNGVYVPFETILKEGDTIALFPPVSGG